MGVALERIAPDGAVATVQGALGWDELGELERLLGAAVVDGARHLVVDLGRSGSVDDTLPGLLVRALRAVRPDGGTVALATGDEHVRSAFATMGLDHQLLIEPTRAAALARAGLA